MTDFQRGNAFLYILVAVVLLGALMFTLSRSAHQENMDGQMDEGKARIAANEIISYMATATNAIVQMQQGGATTSQIDFTIPSDTNFNTAPTIYKLYHPDGGGLNFKPLPVAAIERTGGVFLPPAGMYVGRFNNVEWSPTSTYDTIFTAYKITKSVCELLNEKVNGTATSMPLAAVIVRRFLVDDALHSAGTNVDFTITKCPTCEDKSAGCVYQNVAGTDYYVFYSVIEME